MRLLIIEDDNHISLALQEALKTTYTVDVVHSGAAGIQKVQRYSYSAVVLDLHMPDMSGLKICQLIKKHNAALPVLILTGDAKVMTKISLLDGGADDYLTKPFSLGELKARLRVLIRRRNTSKLNLDRLVVGDVMLDIREHRVERAGREVLLRRKEFSLLECLMKHAGTVVTREMLSNYAWNESEASWTNTVDVHIKYLRDKIDRPFATAIIKTVHGLGYKLEVTKSVSHLIL